MVTAVVKERSEVGGGMFLLSLAVDPPLARAHDAMAQYIEVSVPGASSFFAIASDVGSATWDLLVRNLGSVAETLRALPLGSSVEISQPLGRGVSIADAAGRPVVVAVVGSAIAVARPIVRRRIQDGDAASTHLYVGARADVDLPLMTEIAHWSKQGVRVVLCLSDSVSAIQRPQILKDGSKDGLATAERASGYVQTKLQLDLMSGKVPRGSKAVTAGPEAMLLAVRELGADGALDVLTNF